MLLRQLFTDRKTRRPGWRPAPVGSGRRWDLKRGFGAILKVERLEDRCLPTDWIAIGPAPQVDSEFEHVTGRVTELAVSASPSGAAEPYENLLLGAAGGGVWTTSIADKNSDPVWDDSSYERIRLLRDVNTGLGAGVLAVGSIAVAPSNPQIVYVGTGEWNAEHGLYGTGILKSEDGGKSFGIPHEKWTGG